MPANDLVLYNGNVITLDRDSRIAEAVAIKSGRISMVGSSREVLSAAAKGPEAIDLNGRTVVPGLFDAHPHMDRHGLKSRGGRDLAGITSIRDIQAAVAKAAQEVPEGEWLIFMPLGTPPFDYIYTADQLDEGRFPDRNDLDAAAPNHLVYIRAPWGWWSHRPFPSIANTRALHAASITRDTAAPYNTKIDRDGNDELTGIFFDWNYAPILEYTLFRNVPRFSFEDRITGVRLGAHAYSAVGTTSVYEGHGLTPALIDAYRRIHARGDLTVRLLTPLSIPTASFSDDEIIHILNEAAPDFGGRGTGDDMLRCEGITLDVGDPEVATIIGRDYPYEQWAGHFYQSVPHNRFVEIGVRAARLGLRMNCLVCYDLERVLQAYEAIHDRVPIDKRRWVAIHVTAATDDQIRRMRRLGLIATVTPNFMYMATDRFGLDDLGSEGTPIRRLVDGGLTVALSSDNVPHSMLWTMWEALARWDGDTGRHLGDSQLDREEALRMTCQNGHQLTWDEQTRGSLETGKEADFVVLNDDPLTCDLDEIKELRVDATYVGGRQVYRDRINGI